MKKFSASDREALEQKQRTLGDIDQFLKSTEDPDSPDERTALPRENVLPPPPVEKTDENPFGFVDVITFATHPFFLGLTPTPWQALILKCFYAGAPGNRGLKLGNNRPAKGCDGCVWEPYRQSEEKHLASLKTVAEGGSLSLPMLIFENSPCVQCNRWENHMREARFSVERKPFHTAKQAAEIETLYGRPIEDKFLNEDMMLDDGELDPRVCKQIRDKFGDEFMEMLLVCGRRSGKSFICSAVALYEAYKLVMMGNPQREFRLMEGNNMAIYNVAPAAETARDAIFNPMSTMLYSSPFFQPYIGKGVDLEVHLLTPNDIEFNKKIEKGGTAAKLRTGTIHLVCGHSNAKSLVGRTMVAVLIDELAAMAGEDPDKSMDKILYDDLKPSVATFGRKGKILCMSNPKGPFGLLYTLFQASFTDDTMLMFQLPTWKTNPTIEKAYLEAEKRKDPYSFAMQFGAQFGSGGSSPFLPPEAVKEAFESAPKMRRTESGMPLVRYFAHLDPAHNSDDYVIAIAHAEPMNGNYNTDGSQMMKAVVDHVQIFRAASKQFPIGVEEVDDYLLKLTTRFRFSQISYDHFDSSASIQKMQSWNLNALRKGFTPDYKDKIYQDLFDLFTQGRIEFYKYNTPRPENWNKNMDWVDDMEEAQNQFIGLQRKVKRNRTNIEALKGGKDDICDAVAAACYEALKEKVYTRRARVSSVATRLR